MSLYTIKRLFLVKNEGPVYHSKDLGSNLPEKPMPRQKLTSSAVCVKIHFYPLRSNS
jgi:hypothetical protein